MSHVLVIEDEEDLQQILDYNLRQTKAGLGVTIAGWR